MNKRVITSHYDGNANKLLPISYEVLVEIPRPRLAASTTYIQQNRISCKTSSPTLPYSMSLNGPNNGQLGQQMMEMDPGRNHNQLINQGKFNQLDLNSFNQNDHKNRDQSQQQQP